MRRLLALLGLLCGLSVRAAPLPFDVQAQAYLVQINDEERWARAATRSLAPASLTKLMTALLVLEHGGLEGSVNVTDAAARETGTRLGLRSGERMSVLDLLRAMLVHSANDACHALAAHVAGSEKRFVQHMNARAKAWSLKATQFTNACGHDHPAHRSSARDLAALAQRFMAQPVLATMVALPHVELHTLGATLRRFSVSNSNALVGRYEGVRGIKTGFTPQAGKCVVVLAQRGPTRVLLVLLHGANRWWDASDILDHAFAHSTDAQP